MVKRRITIGRLERIALPCPGLARVQVKVDTGAVDSALHRQRLI